MVVKNTGNATVFFDDQVTSTVSDNLISAQIDPSQPQVRGLSSTANPLVADRHMSARLVGFDSEQFDLSSSSVLMRFLTALIAGSGIGGVRRQQIIARMGVALSGTNFIELDQFWGKIFALNRAPEEALPTSSSGAPIDPSSDVADSVTWDTAQARDGKYRSRIEQLAKGFALGATYHGVMMACQAILNAEVEIVESWLLADYADDGTVGFLGNTYLAVQLQYGMWGNIANNSWGAVALGGSTIADDNQAPLGNRGEVLIIPGRQISETERYQLHLVLNELVPAHMMVTISDTPFSTEQTVSCRGVAADSVDWDVVSVVSERPGLLTGDVDLYPGSNDVESGRPAMSNYSGEQWTFNGRIASVQAYAEDAFGQQQTTVDYQTVTYSDGTSHDYVPTDAMIDSRQLALARAASEGIATTYPYAQGRFS